MAKNKTTTAKGGFSFAGGGSGKMFGKMGVKPSSPGVSVHPTAPGMDKGPAHGGASGGGKQGASVPSKSGGVTVGGHSGSNTFGVKGGSGKMFGKQTAARAQSGTSSKSNG